MFPPLTVMGTAQTTRPTAIFSHRFVELKRAIVFYKDGHVQSIEYNDLQSNSERCYVRCKVLPSMKKTQPYHARVCLKRNGLVDVAYCACTAGLAGCCNHIAAFLYSFEKFVCLGLREEPDSPTSRLCTWNRPRSRKFFHAELRMFACIEQNSCLERRSVPVVPNPSITRFQ